MIQTGQATQTAPEALDIQKPEAPEMMTNNTAYKEELRKLQKFRHSQMKLIFRTQILS